MQALTLKNYQTETLAALESFLQLSTNASVADAYAQTLAVQQRRVSIQPGDGGEAPYRDSFATAERAKPGVAHVCLRIPTGGGKTILGAHAVGTVARTLGSKQLWGARPVVLWLTLTDMVRRQTLDALQQPGHPYALALAEHFGTDVTVLELEQFASLSPDDWGHKTVVLVATIQAFRVNSTLQPRIAHHIAPVTLVMYQHHGQFDHVGLLELPGAHAVQHIGLWQRGGRQLNDAGRVKTRQRFKAGV